MKCFGLVAAFCVVAALVACGGQSGDSPAELERARTVELNAQAAKLTKPVVRPPGKPPKEIVVRDIKEGTGPPARAGDVMTMEYLGTGLDGKEKYSSWDDRELHTSELGFGSYFPGWDKGVKGMKVGGRRELFFPASETLQHGPLFYVVDLLAIE